MIRSFTHPTPECEECNQKALCDLSHLWICPAYQDIMKELDAQILKTLELIGLKGINKWYPSLQEDDRKEIQFTRNDIIISSDSESDSDGEDESPHDTVPTAEREKRKVNKEPPQLTRTTKRSWQSWDHEQGESHHTKKSKHQFSNILEQHLGKRGMTKSADTGLPKRAFRYTGEYLAKRKAVEDTNPSDKMRTTENNRKAIPHMEAKRGVKRKSLAEILEERKKSKSGKEPATPAKSPLINRKRRNTSAERAESSIINLVRDQGIPAKKRRLTIEEAMNPKLLTMEDFPEIHEQTISVQELPDSSGETDPVELPQQRGVGKRKLVQTTLFGSTPKPTKRNKGMIRKKKSKKDQEEKKNKDGQTKEDRAKVTREVFLTKVIKVTTIVNLRKRKLNESTWNSETIKQFRQKKKKTQEKYQMKSRATQGWIPKEIVEEIKKGANMHLNRKRKKGSKTLKVPPETILATCANIVRDILKTNKKLYIKCMKNVRERRKEEGISLAAISNKKLDYRAEMINKTSTKKDRKGKKPNLTIGGIQNKTKRSQTEKPINLNKPNIDGSPLRGEHSPAKGSPSPSGEGVTGRASHDVRGESPHIALGQRT